MSLKFFFITFILSMCILEINASKNNETHIIYPQSQPQLVYNSTDTVFERFVCHGKRVHPKRDHGDLHELIQKCKNSTTLVECQNYCIAEDLNLFIHGRFNMPSILSMLRPEFPEDRSGKERMIQVVREVAGCSQYAKLLSLACSQQTNFWSCIFDAFSC